MSYNFHVFDRTQMMLMPHSLEDWLSEKHLARFLVDAVETMDLKAFYLKYREDGIGNTAYDPSLMVSLLLYGYCVGIRSSRRIEQLLEQDVAFGYLGANQHPDHVTIARFRQENEKELEGLLIEVLKLCQKAGLVKVGVVAVDGTKIKAQAALEANRTLEGIEQEVKKMLKEAAEVDEAEDQKYGKNHRGDGLPQGLQRSEDRKKRLKECKERLEKEAQEAQQAQVAKIAQRAIEETEGKKPHVWADQRGPRIPEIQPKGQEGGSKRVETTSHEPQSPEIMEKSTKLELRNPVLKLTEGGDPLKFTRN